MELLPLMLSVIAFIASLIGAIVYTIRQRNGRKRIKGVVWLACSFLLLLPFLPILPRIGMTPSSVAGAYEGIVGGYQERLILNVDGTFEQQLTSADGRVFDKSGKWAISKSDFGEIDFDNFQFTDFTLQDKPDVGKYSAYVRGYDGALVFSDDTDDHLSRIDRSRP